MLKPIIFTASSGENLKLAQKLQQQLKDLGTEAQIINLMRLKLPLYDMEVEINDGIPSAIFDLVQTMEKAGSYLFVSPEYNGSIPPVLSNTIAWISRADEDFRKLFNDRFILLATHSGSGGTGVTQAMRSQFMKLGSIILSREIVTTYEKKLDEESSLKTLKQFLRVIS